MEEEIQQLKQRIQDLERIVNYFVYPDKYKFERNVQFRGNKIGFYGVDPIAQFSPSNVSIGMVTGSGTTVTEDCKFGGTGTRYTVHDIVIGLKANGIFKK